MPASNKVGTQLLVSPHLRDRARALAIVRHESVAEVWRAALEGGGLAGLEDMHRAELRTLHATLDTMQILYREQAWTIEHMAERRLRLETLWEEMERRNVRPD